MKMNPWRGLISPGVALVALACSSIPEEPGGSEGVRASDSESGKDVVSPVTKARPARRLVLDPYDGLAEVAPVVLKAAGLVYTGDASVVVNQGPDGPVVQLAVQMTASEVGRSLQFSVPLTEQQSKRLFVTGKLDLDGSVLATVTEPKGDAYVPIRSVAYATLPNGSDRIEVTFADEAARAQLPGSATMIGTVGLGCMVARDEMHTVLDDPMIRSPFCRGATERFALTALVP